MAKLFVKVTDITKILDAANATNFINGGSVSFKSEVSSQVDGNSIIFIDIKKDTSIDWTSGSYSEDVKNTFYPGAKYIYAQGSLYSGTSTKDLSVSLTNSATDVSIEDYISGSVDVSTIKLDVSIATLEDASNGKDGLAIASDVYKVINDDELVIAAALNDLNDRITDISNNLGDLDGDVVKSVNFENYSGETAWVKVEPITASNGEVILKANLDETKIEFGTGEGKTTATAKLPTTKKVEELIAEAVETEVYGVVNFLGVASTTGTKQDIIDALYSSDLKVTPGDYFRLGSTATDASTWVANSIVVYDGPVDSDTKVAVESEIKDTDNWHVIAASTEDVDTWRPVVIRDSEGDTSVYDSSADSSALILTANEENADTKETAMISITATNGVINFTIEDASNAYWHGSSNDDWAIL